jgi:hypothetical protein
VTPQVRADLERAAAASGRSMSQEAEFRLEKSFDVTPRAARLVLSRGDAWAPVIMQSSALVLMLGDVSPADEVVVEVSAGDMRRLREYFHAQATKK